MLGRLDMLIRASHVIRVTSSGLRLRASSRFEGWGSFGLKKSIKSDLIRPVQLLMVILNGK